MAHLLAVTAEPTTVSPILRIRGGNSGNIPAPHLSELLPWLYPPNATRLERKDWGRQLSLSLENFRVPAALVAGSALAGAFGISPSAGDALELGLCKRLHLFFSVASFMSSTMTVALATSALVQLNDQDSGRQSDAADLDDYVRRAGYSVELWVAVNAHFIIGLLSLCAAVGLRCCSLLLDQPHEPFGLIGAMMVGSGTLLTISLGMPRSTNGLFGLLVNYTTTIARKALSLRAPAPVLLLSVLLTGAALALTAREIVAAVREMAAAAAVR